jgi:hypothetical protein
MIYYGVVEDINDPEKSGRVRVRIFGVHNKSKVNIPTEDLPWSLVMGPATSPGISGVGHSSHLLRGSWVVGTFVDNECQDFLVFGSIPTKSPKKFSDLGEGFCDATGQYPRQLDEEDNNLRARGRPDPNDYEVQGVYQPRSAYSPQYPYNHVYESESGHLKEYDDTPGATRIRERHNSGTYYEVQPGGSKIERVVADNYELILGDDTIEVKGNVNIIVSEDVNLSVAGNITAHVGKNVEFLAQGDVNGEIRGNIALRVGPNKDDHVTYDDDGVAIHDTTAGMEGYTKLEAEQLWYPRELDELPLYTGDGYLADDGIPPVLQEILNNWRPETIELINGNWVYKFWTNDDQSNAEKILLAIPGGNVDIHIEGTLTGLVDGHIDLTVLNDAKVDIKGNANIDVGGDVDLDVGGDMDTLIQGTYTCESKEAMTFIAPTIDLNPDT